MRKRESKEKTVEIEEKRIHIEKKEEKKNEEETCEDSSEASWSDWIIYAICLKQNSIFLDGFPFIKLLRIKAKKTIRMQQSRGNSIDGRFLIF